MQGSFLRFYVHQDQRHRHGLVWEWLLMRANKLGIRGGSAFSAMAGFGQHHAVHDDGYFELAGTATIEIEFMVSNTEAQQLLDMIHREKLRLFYAHIPARFGAMDRDVADPPSMASGD